jgi:hypothetical protein
VAVGTADRGCRIGGPVRKGSTGLSDAFLVYLYE